MKLSNGKKWYYANGMQLAACRRICEYIFDVFYYRADSSKTEMIFTIHVYSTYTDNKKVVHKLEDYVDVDKFKKHWCEKKQWKLIIIPRES